MVELKFLSCSGMAFCTSSYPQTHLEESVIFYFLFILEGTMDRLGYSNNSPLADSFFFLFFFFVLSCLAFFFVCLFFAFVVFPFKPLSA